MVLENVIEGQLKSPEHVVNHNKNSAFNLSNHNFKFYQIKKKKN